MPAIREPSGWPNRNSTPATLLVAFIRWTSSSTSVTVPATISPPIATTRILSARTLEPLSSPDRFEFTAGPETAGQRIDRVVAAAIGSLSRSRVKQLLAAGQLSRDGKRVTDASEPARPGATYTLVLPPPEPATPLPQAMPLSILHEDPHLIVLDKPAGLVVHPAPGNQDGTLVNALLAHAGDELQGIGGERRPGIVHRLDKDTSGVMVVAKTEQAHRALSADFASRDLERDYLALVWGLPQPPEGEIEGPIGRHPTDRKRMAVVTRGGKPALTRYKVERAWGTAVALLRCRLATGRTHQIRVHLAHRNHPLVGDPVYLRRTPASARNLPGDVRESLLSFPRQALHAASLGFRHPITGQWLAFRSPLPADLAGLLTLLDGNPSCNQE